MSASEFEGHEALIAQLQGGTLDAPGHLRRRVLAAGPGVKRERLPMSRRRERYGVLVLAAGLAVGAAVIHGVVNSGNPSERGRVAASNPSIPATGFGSQGLFPNGAPGPPGPTGAVGPTGPQGPTGATSLQGPT